MKKYLLLYALAATIAALLLFALWRTDRAERLRLAANQSALVERLDTVDRFAERQRASIEVLRLRCREFEALHRADVEAIRSLGIRLRRAESAAVQVIATEVTTAAALRDTVVLRRDTVLLFDTLRRFVWRDPWVRLEGEVRADSVVCRVQSHDTLRQIVHRVPRRFLFFRWGTKAIRQEIRSSNPHTRLVYADYVVIER